MARLLFGHVMANGLKINYYRTGGDKPAVVLLHGLADYGLCWTRFPLFLEPSYDVVMVDMRGHGMSEKPDNGYRAEDMADGQTGIDGDAPDCGQNRHDGAPDRGHGFQERGHASPPA